MRFRDSEAVSGFNGRSGQPDGLPLVATNDAHYLRREDAAVQDVMLCVNTRTTRDDPKRLKMEHDGLYVCSPDEMYTIFKGREDAVARSQEIADRVDIQLGDRKLYPVFRPPNQQTDIEYLKDLCVKRMHERYGDELTDDHWKRLEYELSVIEQKGYASYFLIVWDFVDLLDATAFPVVREDLHVVRSSHTCCGLEMSAR